MDKKQRIHFLLICLKYFFDFDYYLSNHIIHLGAQAVTPAVFAARKIGLEFTKLAATVQDDLRSLKNLSLLKRDNDRDGIRFGKWGY